MTRVSFSPFFFFSPPLQTTLYAVYKSTMLLTAWFFACAVTSVAAQPPVHHAPITNPVHHAPITYHSKIVVFWKNMGVPKNQRLHWIGDQLHRAGLPRLTPQELKTVVHHWAKDV